MPHGSFAWAVMQQFTNSYIEAILTGSYPDPLIPWLAVRHPSRNFLNMAFSVGKKLINNIFHELSAHV